jgi:N-methylhydantoinase A
MVVPDASISGAITVGVDIGGTFTDAVAVRPDGTIVTGKSSTTPSDLSVGFFASIEAMLAELGLTQAELYARIGRLAHGTTAGINALVTRTGARTALVTTVGHGDSLRIMRGSGRTLGASVEEMLDFSRSYRPDPLLEPSDVFEIVERIDAMGDVVVRLRDEEIDRVVDQLVAGRYEAVAVSLLWGFANPAHERAIGRALRERLPSVFVSLSHEVAPRAGEYGRTVACTMNAMIGPLMTRYIDKVVTGARDRGFTGELLFGHVEGGLVPAEEARRFPLGTVQSGPVAGVVGSARYGSHRGERDIVVTDMGGTTLDVSVIANGEPSRHDETIIERQLAFLRKVEVESIGAGGGSIAWIDDTTGLLKVGPQSSGAVPGPACYGRGGTAPTVTDADLVLGILDASRPLASGLQLDLGAAERAVLALGQRLGLGLYECAAGIVEIVDTKMEDLVRRATLQRGHDPRTFTLWSFGGAGGAHAGLYASGLGVKRVVLPLGDAASVWSAFGCAMLEQRRTFQTSLYLHEPFDLVTVADVLETLEANALAYAKQHFADADAAIVEHHANMKYALQVYEVETPLTRQDVHSKWATDAIDRFESVYAEQYGEGTGYRAAGVVLTALRVTVSEPVVAARPRSTWAPPDSDLTPSGRRPVYWIEARDHIETAVFEGSSLPGAAVVHGPAIIEFPNTVVAVRPGQRATADHDGSLVIDLQDVPS